MPQRIFLIWKKWINCRFYPLHGMLLMFGGLPLTFFRDTISGKIMMVVGIVAVFSGPFILLFPNKIRELFALTESELEEGDTDGLIYFDAVLRGIAGALIIYAMLSRGL